MTFLEICSLGFIGTFVLVVALAQASSCNECSKRGGTPVRGVVGYECMEGGGK